MPYKNDMHLPIRLVIMNAKSAKFKNLNRKVFFRPLKVLVLKSLQIYLLFL